MRNILKPKFSIGHYLHSAWYFDMWYEKIILVGLSFCGVIRIIQWIV